MRIAIFIQTAISLILAIVSKGCPKRSEVSNKSSLKLLSVEELAEVDVADAEYNKDFIEIQGAASNLKRDTAWN